MQNGASRKHNFIIVGGSLGGLTAGIALKRHGFDVTILERNPSPVLADQGAGIVAGGDTLSFSQKYDKLQRPLAVRAHGRTYLNKVGETVYKEETPSNMTSWDLAYYLLRANFDGLDSKYLEGRSVPQREEGEGKAVHLHDHAVTRLEECDGGKRMKIFYEKGNGEKGSLEADYVIASDGQGSLIRNIVLPGTGRSFPNYCALRGTLKENDATPATKEAFNERFTFFHGPGIQILAYLIPGANGTLKAGERLINFVYYTNFPTLSDNPSTHPLSPNVPKEVSRNPPNPNPVPFQDIMIDKTGASHLTTVPPGYVAPKLWEREVEFANANLPPQFAELVARTDKPFVQSVTDVNAPQPPDHNTSVFFNGKVVLMGDALAGFRPHTVASTSQAAFHANLLAECFEAGWSTPRSVSVEQESEANGVNGNAAFYDTSNGMGRTSKAQETGQERFVRESLQFARKVQRRGVEIGNRSQFEVLSLEEYIRDRQVATTKRTDEVYPDWVW